MFFSVWLPVSLLFWTEAFCIWLCVACFISLPHWPVLHKGKGSSLHAVHLLLKRQVEYFQNECPYAVNDIKILARIPGEERTLYYSIRIGRCRFSQADFLKLLLVQPNPKERTSNISRKTICSFHHVQFITDTVFQTSRKPLAQIHGIDKTDKCLILHNLKLVNQYSVASCSSIYSGKTMTAQKKALSNKISWLNEEVSVKRVLLQEPIRLSIREMFPDEAFPFSLISKRKYLSHQLCYRLKIHKVTHLMTVIIISVVLT